MRAWGDLNPNAILVISRILVLVDSIKANDIGMTVRLNAVGRFSSSYMLIPTGRDMTEALQSRPVNRVLWEPPTARRAIFDARAPMRTLSSGSPGQLISR